MKRIVLVASVLTLAAAGSAYAKLSADVVAGVQKAIKAIGCTVEASDIMAKGANYKADDVQCKNGQYDMLLDKNFKIISKEKED